MSWYSAHHYMQVTQEISDIVYCCLSGALALPIWAYIA